MFESFAEISIFLHMYIHSRTVEEGVMEVTCELSIALYILEGKIPYKYSVFSPRSELEDSPYEFIHNAPHSFRPGHANRTLCIPEDLQVPEGEIYLETVLFEIVYFPHMIQNGDVS